MQRQKYTSYSGSDIIPTFGGRVIGELLSVSYNISREKGPIYTVGFENPRGFARGRRGIAGSLAFAVFDRNALLDGMRKRDLEMDNDEDKVTKFNTFYGRTSDGQRIPMESQADGTDVWNPTEFNEQLSRVASSGNGGILTETSFNHDIEYADQILPFDITIHAANDYGSRSKITLYDVEILNQGMGLSVNDLALSQNYTFVCRDIKDIAPVDGNGNIQQGDTDTTQYGR